MGIMEIRHLQTFITIARLEGFTKAAEHLGYAQSTITSHIQILEDEIGKPLFDRLGKKIVLTSTGRKLIPYANQILEIYEEIKNIAYDETVASGDLIIGVSESLTIYRLGEILKAYKNQYPNVNLILKSAKCSQLREQLYSGAVDLILTIEPEIKDTDLVTIHLKDELMVLIGAPETDINFLVEHQNDIAVESKSIQENIILSEEGCMARIAFQQYLKEKKMKYPNPIEIASIEGIKNSVIGGLGISVVPYYTVEKEVSAGQLKMLEIPRPFPSFKTQLSYHKSKSINLAMEKFIESVEVYKNKWS